MKAYILAKNEENNIAKCLSGLAALGIETIVFDSGSTDRTIDIAKTFAGASVVSYKYTSHKDAYNQITSEAPPEEWRMILDADMEVTPELHAGVLSAIDRNEADVVVAPVIMYVDGAPLQHGSLYPPKPIVFRSRKEYFVASGHGERLVDGCRTTTTAAKLIHNDLKPYETYLLSQVRYGRQLAKRRRSGDCRLRDRLRTSTPFMGIVAALYSLVVRGGALSGRVAWAYAMDRLIAGIVQYRVCLEERIQGQKQ